MQSHRSSMKPGIRQTPRVAVNPLAGAPIPFARANAFAPFVAFLRTTGAPADRFLRRARIPVGMFDDPEGLIPLFPGYRFLEVAARQEKLDELGVLVGERTSAFELGAYGTVLRKASTVYEYIRDGIRLIDMHSSGTRLWGLTI